MAIAERSARHFAPDYLLWLNDDTVLDRDAIVRMLSVAHEHPSSIIVGATRAPETGVPTYGGRMRVGHHPLRVTDVRVGEQAVVVDTFNGNCVLIPAVVREAIGPIDGLFAHAFADDDYAYRAASKGVRILQVPGTVGICEANPLSRALSPRAAWRQLRSPKGLPLHSHIRFLRRHARRTWPFLVVWGQIGYLRRVSRRG